MSAVLSVNGLVVRFGGVHAVDDLSFEVRRNELLGLIGPNGAGKTTLMRALTGSVLPLSGRLTFRGVEIRTLPTHQRIRLGIGLSQQIVKPFPNLTAIDNVGFAAGGRNTQPVWKSLLRLSRIREREKARLLLQRLGIDEFADAMPGELPLGVLKRLELARVLALEPELLLLDEPLAGLNHVEAARIADIISGLVAGGLTIILIEHNLGEVLRICSRMIVLDNGKKIAEGDPQAVMADQAVRAAYLGT